MKDELQTLISEVQSMVETVVTDRSVSSSDLRRVLKFLTKVVQVVDQAFQDVYATLIDFKFLTAEDINSGRLQDLRKELALLLARDRYRDAEQICSRLHGLSEQYKQQIEPIVLKLRNPSQWYVLFSLLNEYEGQIIMMVNHAVWELEHMLGSINKTSLSLIRQTAGEKADAIRVSLVNLQSLKDQILGLSGDPGFLELTEIDRSSLERQVIIMGDNVAGNKPTYSIGNISNSTVSGVALGDNNAVISNLNVSGQTELAQALKTLTDAVLASKNLPEDKKQEQVQVINQIGKEASDSQPNKTMLKILVDGLMTTLKAVPDIAGAVIAVAPMLTSLFR